MVILEDQSQPLNKFQSQFPQISVRMFFEVSRLQPAQDCCGILQHVLPLSVLGHGTDSHQGPRHIGLGHALLAECSDCPVKEGRQDVSLVSGLVRKVETSVAAASLHLSLAARYLLHSESSLSARGACSPLSNLDMLKGIRTMMESQSRRM